MNGVFNKTFLQLVVAGILSFLGTATTVAQEERPTRAVWKKWQRDISQFEVELRKVVSEAKLPKEEALKKRFEEKSSGLEVVTDGYGGVVDFDAAEGTVQYVANERFGGMNIEWEFELAKDTKVNWDKSTKLIPRIAGAAKGEGQESETPLFAIAIEKPDAGPFQAGDRVRLKASIDDFSRFRKDFSRAMGLVAIYYLEEGPNPVFLLKLDEAEITLVEGEEKVGQVKRQPYMDELPDDVSAMAGLWRIDPDFDRLLETPAENNRHPNSLRLSFAVPGAPMLSKETISLIEDLFVQKMKHTIIAVGNWEAEKDSRLAADRDSNCFVTTKHGVTYMWFGTPDKSLVGSKVDHVWVGTRKAALNTRWELDAAPANTQTRKHAGLLASRLE